MSDALVMDALAAERTVTLAAAGDRAAFARLVEEHHPAMARVAYVICGDAEAARDAVGSAWSIAWRRIGTVREPARIGTWLVAIAANEARAAVRRRRRAPALVDLADIPDSSGGGDPADRIAVVDLRRALSRLDADDRVLLALRFVAGLDSTAIATQLGLSPSGVRSRLSRLIDRLRLELDR